MNHKTAPVETRERLAVLETHLAATLQALMGTGSLKECCVLSTCNRTEFYGLGDTAGHAVEGIAHVLALRSAMPREHLQPLLYHRFNEDAARHLFSVAAGLDSMIVGEGQILGQVRGAHRAASAERVAGSVLGKLFERGIHVGKRVRSETRIAQGAASVSAAAVELARRIHGDLETRHALVVGTGKMGLQTVKLLAAAGVSHISILSRTIERARAAAGSLGAAAEAASMERLADHLVEADIVVSCTASPVAVITRAAVGGILRRRKYRPLFVVDIAVPRDVEPAVNDLDGVYLYNIDDLSSVVSTTMSDRQREIEGARAIVEDEVEQFARWFAALGAVPAIRRLREAFEQTRERTVASLLTREGVSDGERERLEALSRGLINRLLHGPMVRIKEMALTRNVHDGLSFLMDVFEEVPGPQPSDAAAAPSEEEAAP